MNEALREAVEYEASQRADNSDEADDFVTGAEWAYDDAVRRAREQARSFQSHAKKCLDVYRDDENARKYIRFAKVLYDFADYLEGKP